MQHRYDDVPGHGRVVLSHHAQDRAEEQQITDRQIEDVLFEGHDIPDGDSTLREFKGIRVVIITPSPWKGAKLVKTIYKVLPARIH